MPSFIFRKLLLGHSEDNRLILDMFIFSFFLGGGSFLLVYSLLSAMNENWQLILGFFIQSQGS